MTRSNSHNFEQKREECSIVYSSFCKKWLIPTGTTTEELEQENEDPGSK